VGAERLIPAAGLESLAPPPRRERNAEQTKRRLLDAAESEFAAKGFDGARLSSIARVAGVQQQLVHHYFADKAGLYRAVVSRGLGAMTAEGWNILERLAPPRSPRSKKRMTPNDVRALAEAFVELMVDFYATHGALLLILRHDVDAGGSFGGEIAANAVRPQFDAICARLEEMRVRGEIRRDTEPRHLVISAMAMACYPYVEERFTNLVWPIDVRSAEFIAARKREIVTTILARIVP
jgi:AcrR family transcriptional regulator